ncbi:MAG: SDR family oxidoreductase [Proteobacteria bacterium]|nr:SDR family oxidoreductase [Pseudomonadota bacterium]
MKLKDKVAIITGGSAGIGKAIALGMANEGANIVITARNEERLKTAEQDIKAVGVEVLALKSDVSVISDIKGMIDKTIKKFGKIDILVNNAAISGSSVPFLEKDEETFDSVVAINQKGFFFCTQLVAREMVKKKYGKIIGICSAQARVGIPLNSDYSGTKGAMLAMTRVMAAELSPMGINVNAIACGLTTDTKLISESKYPKEIIQMIVNTTPMRRTASVKDYIGMAILLASDEGSFITGQTISVDGGASMP